MGWYSTRAAPDVLKTKCSDVSAAATLMQERATTVSVAVNGLHFGLRPTTRYSYRNHTHVVGTRTADPCGVKVNRDRFDSCAHHLRQKQSSLSARRCESSHASSWPRVNHAKSCAAIPRATDWQIPRALAEVLHSKTASPFPRNAQRRPTAAITVANDGTQHKI